MEKLQFRAITVNEDRTVKLSGLEIHFWNRSNRAVEIDRLILEPGDYYALPCISGMKYDQTVAISFDQEESNPSLQIIFIGQK